MARRRVPAPAGLNFSEHQIAIFYDAQAETKVLLLNWKIMCIPDEKAIKQIFWYLYSARDTVQHREIMLLMLTQRSDILPALLDWTDQLAAPSHEPGGGGPEATAMNGPGTARMPITAAARAITQHSTRRPGWA